MSRAQHSREVEDSRFHALQPIAGRGSARFFWLSSSTRDRSSSQLGTGELAASDPLHVET